MFIDNSSALTLTNQVKFYAFVCFQIVIEKGKTRFRCGQCGTSYSSRWNLRVHTRLHEGKYPYYCPTCKKGCGSSNQLKNHMSTHTGKLQFICNTCGAEFQYKRFLTEHTKETGHIDDCRYHRVGSDELDVVKVHL